ncbi:LysR family transcriptional regulator [Streptomyces sp. NPDC002536]
MELRQIEHFLVVAQEQHFTRAAQRLHVAQSTLSSSIRNLERELGQQLLVRTTRRVEITAAGRALLPAARRMQAAAAEARAAVAEVGALLRGRVTIGLIQTLEALDVPALLAEFRAAHPGVELRLVQGDSAQLIEGVRTHAYDLALVTGDLQQRREDVILSTIAEDRVVLVTAPDHPLARRDRVELGDLAPLPFIDFRELSSLRTLIDTACAHVGIERQVTCQVEHMPGLIDLVAHGLGVALVPRSTADASAPRVASVEVLPAISRRIAVATAAPGPVEPAARVLLELVRNRAESGLSDIHAQNA